MTEIGMRAVTQHGFKPFIDASCRREPDFENDYPSITSLCRQEMFAPNLYPNDIVIYITVKGKWLTNYDHYRLIAILEVIDRKDNHLQAASWYRTNSQIGVPSNCMVTDNMPHMFHETAGNFKTSAEVKRYLNHHAEKQQLVGERRLQLWNDGYLVKSKKWKEFIITKPVFRELTNPPILTDDHMNKIFGKVPNTRNPNKVTKEQFKEIAKHADINFISD